MKRFLLSLSTILLVASNLSAQLTLTETSYPVTITGTDSLKTTTYLSSFPPLGAMAGGLWDMSIVTDSTPLSFICHLNDLTYQYADSNKYSRGGFAYQGNLQCAVTTAALYEYGVLVKKDSYSLLGFTLGIADSLIIPEQHMAYSSPRIKIAFPATYNSHWSCTYSSDLNFDLSVAVLSYNHSPGYIRRYTTEQDTVTGWGKMRVKDLIGVPSDSFNVLQVQTTTTKVDSFFVNGAPFPLPLLSQLNITQGSTDTSYQQNYYQAAEFTPLAQVTFTDATYTQPRNAVTQVKHMIGTTHAVNEDYKQELQVYPDPVSGSTIFVKLPATEKGNWRYTLIDVSGKVIDNGALQTYAGQRATTLPLPASSHSGSYYLKLSADDGSVYTRAVTVIR